MTSLARRAPPVDHAVVVELVGAAAAGKSTLVAELRRRDPQIRWLQRARGDGGAVALAREALRFAPAWFAAVPRAPRHTLRHTRYYLRLATLDGVVRRPLALAGVTHRLPRGRGSPFRQHQVLLTNVGPG